MAFQASVSTVQGFGVVGELYTDGPHRAQDYILNSSAQAQYIGYAYTKTGEGTAKVGGTGIFAGILGNPKAYASRGTTAGGSLAPTLILSDNESGEVLGMGSIVVSLPAAAVIGDLVAFNNTTGALTTMSTVCAFTASQTTTVLTVSAITAGNTGNIGIGSIVNTGATVVTVVSLGTGTGGTGTYNVNVSQSVGSGAMTATPVAVSGTTLAPNTKVDYFTPTGAGLAVITLTN